MYEKNIVFISCSTLIKRITIAGGPNFFYKVVLIMIYSYYISSGLMVSHKLLMFRSECSNHSNIKLELELLCFGFLT